MKTQLSYLKTLLIYTMGVQASSWAAFGCFNHKYLILVSKPENWVWLLQGREWKSGKKGSKTKRGMSSSKVWYQGDVPRPFCQRGLEVLPKGSVNKILIDEWFGDLERPTGKVNLQFSSSMIGAGRWEMLWSLQTLLVTHMGFQSTL